MKEVELLSEGYFLQKSADSGYGEESWLKKVHNECDERVGDNKSNKFYYIHSTRYLQYINGKAKVIGDGEYKASGVFKMCSDLQYPSEGDYLFNIGWCPYCGARLES